MTEGTFAFNRSQQVVLALVAAFAAFSLLLIPAHKADAAGLIDRVNEAIREAGDEVTAERSNAFQKGVFVGHYAGYTQLVGAIAYHNANGTIPSFTGTMAAVTTQCLTTNIVSLSDSNLTISIGDVANVGQQYRSMKIGTNQYDVAISKGAKAGSNVTVCSADNWASQYGHLTVVSN